MKRSLGIISLAISTLPVGEPGSRTLARALAPLLGLLGLAVLAAAGANLVKMTRRRGVPWRAVLRRAGWRSLALTAGFTVGAYVLGPALDLTCFFDHSLSQAVLLVGPLVAAIQAASLVTPEGEPSLEVVLACPHPFLWIAVEHLAVVLGGQALVAAAAVAAGGLAFGEPVLIGLANWAAATLFLAGLAAYTGVRTRRATTGVLMALMAWFVLGSLGSYRFDDILLPPAPLGSLPSWPRPLGLVQPFLWMMHPFLRPDSLTLADFALNRLIVGGLGAGMLALAVRLLADPERTLLGRGSTRTARAVSPPPSLPGKGAGGLGPAGAKTRTQAGLPCGDLPARPGKGRASGARHARLAQLAAIVRYELVQSWRRRALPALLVALLLLPQTFHGVAALFGSLTDAIDPAAWPEAAFVARTDGAIVATIGALVAVILMLPLMLADLIPLDRQHRIREAIRSLPVGRGVYLAGKMASAWLVVAAGMALSSLLNGVLAWQQNGPFHPGPLAAYWTAGLIPLALFTSQMGVMLSAGRADRRRAVPTAIAASAAGLVALLILPTAGYFGAAILRQGFAPEQLSDPAFLAAAPGYPDLASAATLTRMALVALVMAGVWIVTVRRHDDD